MFEKTLFVPKVPFLPGIFTLFGRIPIFEPEMLRPQQGWEFDHLFSERIALFFVEKMSDSLIKRSHSLILSFLVSHLSDSLTVAHFWWGIRVNRSWLLSLGEWPKQFAHNRSFVMSNLSDSLTSLFKNREWTKRSVFFLLTTKNF